jgi:hypothetical protein
MTTTNTRTRRTPEDTADLIKNVKKALRKAPASIHEIGARAGLCNEGDKLSKTDAALVRKALTELGPIVARSGKTRNTVYGKAE